MLRKFLVVVSCLYVVGASVLPDKFVEDLNSDLPEEQTRSCSASACDSVCVWLGYPLGGVCIGSDCYCWVSKTKSVKLDKTAVTQNYVTGEADVEDSKARSCDSSACNAICVWLGFARGQCEGNVCYCYTSKNDGFKVDKAALKNDVKVDTEEDDVTNTGSADVMTAGEPAPRSCSTSSCNSVCIWLGYPLGGVCIGSDCYCYISKSSSIKISK